MRLTVQFPEWVDEPGNSLLRPARFKSIRGGRYSGKSLRDDTPIATPDGWSTMGALRVGDRVFGTDGRPVAVLGVFPQGQRAEWEIRFAHGPPIYADGDHLWRMTDHLWRKRRNRRGESYDGWQAIPPATTEQLAGRVRHGKRGDRNLSVPLPAPLELPAADLLVAPYALGLWLGDGTTKQGALTCTPDDAAHYRRHLEAVGEWLGDPFPSRVGKSAPTYPMSPTQRRSRPNRESMQSRLRELGVFGRKRIPTIYLRASFGQRLELLAGLMDTDGTVDAAGTSATFATTTRVLADGVAELLVSLGHRPTITEARARLNGRDVGPRWSVRFFPFPGCVSLSRKTQRIRPKGAKANRDRQWMVDSIQPTGRAVSMTCIAVDAADSMFLAGRNMVPTHNSHTFAQMALMRMEGALPWYPPPPVRIASARDYQTRIKESVKQVVESYIKQLDLGHRFIVRDKWIDHVNGSHMFFPGVTRQEESFPSMEAIDVFWMEQAEHLYEEMALIEPTIRKPGSEMWFSWNPLERASYCWQRFEESPMDGDVHHWRNYDELPPEWISDEIEQTRQWWAKNEPTLYRWMWLGYPNDADAELAILPYDLLATCVDAYQEYAPDMTGRPVTYAGLDFAEGGRNKCAVVIRQGPNVELVEDWPGVTGDTATCASTAKSHCAPYNVIRIYYDASAPLRTELRRVGFKGVRPFNFGGAVGGPEWFYEPGTRNKDIFARRNIQAATNLRLRANRTYRLVNGDKKVRPEDCLFINPGIREREKTLGQFSQPKRQVNPVTGKWEVIKTSGNEDSPDRYDALVMAFGVDTDKKGLRAR